MKEDYLWDKTGSDPEIEKLENALSVFRYKETAPPEIPAKVVSFPVQRGRKTFRFLLAAAACLAFGVVSLGVWFQILRNNMADQTESAKISRAQTEPAAPDKIFEKETAPVQKANGLTAENLAVSENPSRRRLVKMRKSPPVPARRKELSSPNYQQAKSVVRLSEEEQYAYNQLMIALSITSSKLKIVRDKVEGFDEKTAVLENAR